MLERGCRSGMTAVDVRGVDLGSGGGDVDEHV